MVWLKHWLVISTYHLTYGTQQEVSYTLALLECRSKFKLLTNVIRGPIIDVRLPTVNELRSKKHNGIL
jgi:hypothetical protein